MQAVVQHGLASCRQWVMQAVVQHGLALPVLSLDSSHQLEVPEGYFQHHGVHPGLIHPCFLDINMGLSIHHDV